MKNAKFNVTQYLSALLKAYPTALFEKTVMMRTVDKGTNYNSLIFNEKYGTTEAEYNKKKEPMKKKAKVNKNVLKV